MYRGDAAALAESLGRIQRAAGTILTAIGVDGMVDRQDSRAAA